MKEWENALEKQGSDPIELRFFGDLWGFCRIFEDFWGQYSLQTASDNLFDLGFEISDLDYLHVRIAYMAWVSLGGHYK